jgi:Family of unknown function (DUF5317)
MSLFIALVTVGSFVVGLVRGRSVDDIAGNGFRWSGFLVLGAGLHGILALKSLAGLLGLAPLGSALPLGAIIYILSYVSLIVFLVANLSRPGFLALLGGLGMNFLMILLNAGRMPSDPQQLAAAGLLTTIQAQQTPGLWSPYVVAGSTTPLAWLDDRIIIPLPYHEPVLVSIGDLFIALGCFLFFNDPFKRVRYRFTSDRRFGRL